MSNADPRGKFVWHELLTPDAAAATAFYTKVVPWKTQPWDQDASYTMWVAKNGPVGGIAALGDSGAPHWLPYIGVTDVAGTVETAKGLGGSVLKEPTDLPSGGSYAVLADPQGARFAIHKSASAYNGAPPPAAGDFTWHELATSDAKAAMDFYTKLFGWEAGPVHDMGAEGLYHLFLREGTHYGGMYVSRTGEPNWLCYIGVDDAGKAVAAAKAAGGRVLNGPMEVPGGSWVAQVMDKHGAPFAVIESKMAAAASPPPSAKPAKPKAPKAEKPAAAAAAPAAAEPSAAVKPVAAKPAAARPAAKPAAAQPAPATPAAKPAAAKPASKAPAKAAKKAKKAAAKGKAARGQAAKGKAARGKAARGKAAKKSAARGKARVAAKQAPAKKSAAKRAPARKKSAARAKAKKHR